MERWTIGSLLETAAGYLRDKGSASPRLDAELLLADSLGLDRIHLYTEFDRPLAPDEVDRYRSLIGRRAAHEPVAYITGRAYFRHLCLAVTPAVLIPRPETEELVDVALLSLRRRPLWDESAANLTPGLRSGTVGDDVGAGRAGAPGFTAPPSGAAPAPLVADVGTGSGAIALSLAQEAGVRVLAIDASGAALEVAAGNAAAAGLDRLVHFVQADLLAGIADRSLHLVVSNPPYVSSGDLASLAPDIRLYEPALALDAGPDGLAVMRRLIPEAARVLRPGGSVILEVGDRQAETVAGLARDAGFSVVTVYKDLSQKDRVVEATLPGALVVSVDDLDEVRTAAVREALGAGAIIGVPTDTVYGIAARWDSAAGVRRLFAAKGRPPDQPVQVLFASVDAVAEALPDLDPVALGVLMALLPGPYTFVVATAVARPEHVGTAESLGVRVPDHPLLLDLLRMVGTPLAATSANLSGSKDVLDAGDVDPAVLAHCSLAFAGVFGCSSTEPSAEASRVALKSSASTVVDLRPLSSGGVPSILREGAVPSAEVLRRIAAVGRGSTDAGAGASDSI